MKCQFFPNFSAEQHENASGTSRGQSTHLNMRCLRIGPSPTAGKDPDSGHYTNAEAFEDAKLYHMSGIKTFYTSKCAARGYTLTEEIQADPAPDYTTIVRHPLSNRRWYTFGDELDYDPFHFGFDRNTSDDYDMMWTIYIEVGNLVIQGVTPPLSCHPAELFRFDMYLVKKTIKLISLEK